MRENTFLCDGCGCKMTVEGSIKGMRPPIHEDCGIFRRVLMEDE